MTSHEGARGRDASGRCVMVQAEAVSGVGDVMFGQALV